MSRGCVKLGYVLERLIDLHGGGLVGDGLQPVAQGVHLHLEQHVETVSAYSLAGRREGSSARGRVRE